MNSTEVAQLFADFCDEPNSDFLSSAKTLRYLDRGHRAFRRQVRLVSPNAYAVRVGITLASQNEYDLSADTSAEAVTLLGETPTEDRMANLHRVGWVDSLSDLTRADWLKSVADRRSLRIQSGGFDLYCLDGTTLVFSEEATGVLAVSYTPEVMTSPFESIDAYIDDWNDYHELIALYAFSYYSIRDDYENTELVKQRRLLEKSLAVHGKLRGQEQPLYVNRTWDTY